MGFKRRPVESPVAHAERAAGAAGALQSERLEERVKRRQERSMSDQTILVAELASKLQRQVAWLNSTSASSNSAMASKVQQMAGLESKLGKVRAETLRRLAQQKLDLETLDKSQNDAFDQELWETLVTTTLWFKGSRTCLPPTPQ